MRTQLIGLLVVAFGLASSACVRRAEKDAVAAAVTAVSVAESTPTRVAPVAFDAGLRPLLETRCGRCHFPGGKMHARLPFDDEATVRTLGAEKLFTRIEDEEGRRVVDAYFASTTR